MIERNQLNKGQSNYTNHSVKSHILESYFANTQRQFDEEFINDIFQLSKHQSQMQILIVNHSLNLLCSSQEISKLFLVKLLSYPKFQKIAHNFIKDVITLKITIYNTSFQLFIIEQFTTFLQLKQFQKSQILAIFITYLALKLRSFNFKMKLAALKALKTIGNDINQIQKQKYWNPVLKQIMPSMIQKQKLVREVSYTKGLFLQVLEDQYSEIRKTCLQCLILFRRYFKLEDLKLIIVYMLNDEHQIVREQALTSTQYLSSQLLNKQDLMTIMMCLKQKRSNMRKLVYQTLSSAIVSQINVLLLIIQKSLQTLQNYKIDKKNIYRMLYKLGSLYTGWVEQMIQKLALVDSVEPNWKNVSYKGKMIFCYQWWQSANTQFRVPFYFNKHMLYISDVQSYLFQQKEEIILGLSNIDPSNMTKQNLLNFIQCEEDISQDFHKQILQIIRNLVSGSANPQQIKNKLTELEIQYNLQQQEIDIVNQLEKQIKNTGVEGFCLKINLILKKIIKNRQSYQKKDQQILKNKCSISKVDIGIIIINKCRKFQERIFLKCLKNHLISPQPKFTYKRLVQCTKIRQDEDYDYWQTNLSCYSKIECICLMTTSQRTLDTYEVDYRL